MSSVPTRSSQQLAEVLAALATSDGESTAFQRGIERIAESFEAEVGAVIRDGTVLATIGYPAGRAPLAELVEVARGDRTELIVPGLGPATLVSIPVPTEAPSTLVLARSGTEAFDKEEVSLLRAMARVLAIALNVVHYQDEARAILGAASEAYLAVDGCGRILAWNEQAAALFGWSPDEAIGRDFVEMIVPPRHRDLFRERLAKIRETGEDEVLSGRVETHALYRDGHEVPVEFASWITPHGAGHKINAFVHDISERKAAADRLAHQALHDPLTGLPNRELFLDRLEQALRQLTRRDRLVMVMFMDLDRFKPINDSMGHATGDIVLLNVAERVRVALRLEDTVARLGGDEFTILCPDLPSDTDVRAIATRVLEVVAEPVTVDGHELVVSASIGVAIAQAGHVDAEELLSEADSAMYHAKQRGRNRFLVFDEVMRARSEARLSQSNELRRALERDELRVVYQPIVEVSNELAYGAEALVRWAHPDLGLIGPEHFIAMAEDTRLVVPLGAWVLREAVAEVASWTAQPGDAPLVLSVNLSARQLTEPGLHRMISSTLEETGFDPARLCLEITETVLMDDSETSHEVLRSLKQLGVKLAIDDFGTGYSSLAYLRRFHVDSVKVDRSFVAGLGQDPAADAIVAAVINLAHSLGLLVVAEGVETREQLAALHSLGCDRAQGYYWSRPVRADLAREWLERPRPTTLRPALMDVGTVVAERARFLRSRSGRNVVLQGPASLPAAFADHRALVTVLDQILASAGESSLPTLPIVVSAASDRHWLRVSVADFGHGHAHPNGNGQANGNGHVRLDGAGHPDRETAGRVARLAPARELVEAMSGRMGIRSNHDAGAVVTFALPREPRAVPRARSSRGEPLDIGARSVVGEFMRQLGISGRPA